MLPLFVTLSNCVCTSVWAVNESCGVLYFCVPMFYLCRLALCICSVFVLIIIANLRNSYSYSKVQKHSVILYCGLERCYLYLTFKGD
jgi:hypothetical protein